MVSFTLPGMTEFPDLNLLFLRGWKRAIPSGKHGLIRSLASSAVDGAPCEHQHDARVLPQH